MFVIKAFICHCLEMLKKMISFSVISMNHNNSIKNLDECFLSLFSLNLMNHNDSIKNLNKYFLSSFSLISISTIKLLFFIVYSNELVSQKKIK